MGKSKKFILGTVLALIVLVGSTIGVIFAQNSSTSPAGVAFAQSGTGNVSQPKPLLARVAEILGIDQQKLEGAFAQAQREMQEEALNRYLQKLVEEGKITQQQADQYKAWSQARPDMEPFRQQLKEWQQARPDIPLPGRFGGRGVYGGMKWGLPPHFQGWAR